MKYSLAFLFVAATAILVASAPPPQMTARQQAAQGVNQLLTARQQKIADLTHLLANLAHKVEEGMVLRNVPMTLHEHQKYMPAVYMPALTEIITKNDLAELITELRDNQAQRANLARTALQSGTTPAEIERLTHLRQAQLNDIQEPSRDKLCTLHKVFLIFFGHQKEAFLPHLTQAGVCNWYPIVQNPYGANDPDYIIAEKIYDSSNHILKLVLQSATSAGIVIPI